MIIRAYKDTYNENIHVIAESTFTNIWKALMPSLQFMTPKSDLYDTCKMMKMDIQYTTQYEKKLELTKNFLAHLNRAQEEHDYYNINIVNTIEDGKHNQNIVGSQVLFKSFDAMAYIAYDLAQNVQIPNSHSK
ncbi:chaperonin: PROVISIONAL [Gigaspora margarita]|uniref:Chaperonin: PROVISIONAL n=1 Tax=Gigaspora margarita TaxID=4874 RepID=A0A8H4AYM5_GIGMA|nr:chaperonin: PROVISIONAL [Gigaspora margarita]